MSSDTLPDGHPITSDRTKQMKRPHDLRGAFEFERTRVTSVAR